MSYRFSAEERLEREAAMAELRRYLDRIFESVKLGLSYHIESLEPRADAVEKVEIRVLLRGADEGLLLARRGELLEALEYIAVRWLRLDPRLYDRVQFEAADYRSHRLEELKVSARIAANRVIENGQPFRFPPMPARERRIIHLVLAEIPQVLSASEGMGEERRVVVKPAQPGSVGQPSSTPGA